MEWLQSLVQIWLKTEINNILLFKVICQILQPECAPISAGFGSMKLNGHCGFCSLVYVITLWGFLWRSFISNIEWWCSVLTKASAAVVWHAFPLELPRLESVGGNLSGCWRPWWKPWIVAARKISEWEELPDLSGIRPCLMFSKPVGVSMDLGQV